MEHTSPGHAASVGRPPVAIHSTPIVPPSITSARAFTVPAVEPPINRNRDRR